MKLLDELPVDHRLAQVYRYGAGLCGVALLVFGCLGFANGPAFFSTQGEPIAGPSSNGLLSLLSVLFAVALIAGAVIGGNTASTISIVVGAAFVVSGFINLGLLESNADFLAFRMPNVMFSFITGLVIATFGMYGRVSWKLPHDNPYWRARHPEQAEAEQRRLSLPGGGAGQRPPITS